MDGILFLGFLLVALVIPYNIAAFEGYVYFDAMASANAVE
jgi:hypothetical protein